jgi:hypothetical protein
MDLLITYNEEEQEARRNVNTKHRQFNLEHKADIDAGRVQRLEIVDVESTTLENFQDWLVVGLHTVDGILTPFRQCSGNVSQIAGTAVALILDTAFRVAAQNAVANMTQVANAQRQQAQTNQVAQRVIRDIRNPRA